MINSLVETGRKYGMQIKIDKSKGDEYFEKREISANHGRKSRIR